MTHPTKIPSTGPRYKVQYTGEYKYESRSLPYHYAEVRDSWTGTLIKEFQSDGKEIALLLAETLASEMNAPLSALTFTFMLGIHMERVINELEGDRGNLCEDVIVLLDHYVGQLRGRAWEPLDTSKLHYSADWINEK